jgi:hypothetical protein
VQTRIVLIAWLGLFAALAYLVSAYSEFEWQYFVGVLGLAGLFFATCHVAIAKLSWRPRFAVLLTLFILTVIGAAFEAPLGGRGRFLAVSMGTWLIAMAILHLSVIAGRLRLKMGAAAIPLSVAISIFLGAVGTALIWVFLATVASGVDGLAEISSAWRSQEVMRVSFVIGVGFSLLWTAFGWFGSKPEDVTSIPPPA